MINTPSVMDSVWPQLDSWFGDAVHTRTGARELLGRSVSIPDISAWYSAVSPLRTSTSTMLWKWRLKRDIDPANESPEKILEKEAARLLPAPQWANQIPAAAGLSLNAGDNRRNIDLGQRTVTGTYRLIELKYESDNPVYAVRELMGYALLYWWVRKHPETHVTDREDGALFAAADVQFEVLAPRPYFDGYDSKRLCHLADALTAGLAQLAKGEANLRFQYTVLGNLKISDRQTWTTAMLAEAFKGEPLT